MFTFQRENFWRGESERRTQGFEEISFPEIERERERERVWKNSKKEEENIFGMFTKTKFLACMNFKTVPYNIVQPDKFQGEGVQQVQTVWFHIGRNFKVARHDF